MTKHAPEELAAAQARLAQAQYDENGVDVSFIRMNLQLTPTERARRGERARQAVLRVAEIGRVGQAEVLMGGARATFDVDLCYRQTAANLERIFRSPSTRGRSRWVSTSVPRRHLGRPKDRESLLQLEAIKRLRDREGLR
jgi:hypothetical protein